MAGFARPGADRARVVTRSRVIGAACRPGYGRVDSGCDLARGSDDPGDRCRCRMRRRGSPGRCAAGLVAAQDTGCKGVGFAVSLDDSRSRSPRGGAGPCPRGRRRTTGPPTRSASPLRPTGRPPRGTSSVPGRAIADVSFFHADGDRGWLVGDCEGEHLRRAVRLAALAARQLDQGHADQHHRHATAGCDTTRRCSAAAPGCPPATTDRGGRAGRRGNTWGVSRKKLSSTTVPVDQLERPDPRGRRRGWRWPNAGRPFAAVATRRYRGRPGPTHHFRISARFPSHSSYGGIDCVGVLGWSAGPCRTARTPRRTDRAARGRRCRALQRHAIRARDPSPPASRAPLQRAVDRRDAGVEQLGDLRGLPAQHLAQDRRR